MDEFDGHFQFVCNAGEVRTMHSFCFSVGLFRYEKSCRVLVSLAFLEVVNPRVGCRHVVVMRGMSELMPEGGACVIERHPRLQDDDSRFRIPAATLLAWQVAFDYRYAVSACQVFELFQLSVPTVVIFRKGLGAGVCGVGLVALDECLHIDIGNPLSLTQRSQRIDVVLHRNEAERLSLCKLLLDLGTRHSFAEADSHIWAA